jgi:uncharacterized membrane protein
VAREARRRSRGRLDQPRDTRRGLALPRYDADAWGRISDRIARFLGTWTFIGYMTLFIAIWLLWNIYAPKGARFDPAHTHFTGMTLLLSLQASYAAPLILLSQNRQADRDRVQFDQDRALSERTVADTEFVAREVAALRLALGEVATRDFLRGELQRMLDELAVPGRDEASPGD